MAFAAEISDEVRSNDFEHEEGMGHSVWTRDQRNNKILPHLQIKDLSKVIDENTIFVWDFDGIPFKAAGMIEDDYIIVTNVETKEKLEFKNITEFWGRSKKSIAANSALGVINVNLEVEGKDLLTKEDFLVEKGKRLKTKFINTGTEMRWKKEDPINQKKRVNMDLSDCNSIVEARVAEVQNQWGVRNFLMCLGSGEVFRDRLDLPEAYKGQRDPIRPIFLKESRAWVETKYKTKIAPKDFECDDLVEWYGAKGYADYKKTGKFSYVIIAEDKDAMGNPKLLINYGRAEGKFKYPQAILIEDTATTSGSLEFITKASGTDVKGTGLKWIVMQAFCLGDTSDNYHPYLKLDKPLREHIKYGKTEAYKEYVKLESPKEILQLAVDNMLLWFPKGVQYVTHYGRELDVSTLAWMETCFTVAYMTRSPKDKTTFTALCKHFKVDLSKIETNNVVKQFPLQEEEELRKVIRAMDDHLLSIITALQFTTGTKGAILERQAEAVQELHELQDNLHHFYNEEV